MKQQAHNNSTVVQREYLSPNEIAELLGVSPFTIRRYIKLGELRAIKLLGGFRVHRDDIQRFLKAHEVNPAEEDLDPAEIEDSSLIEEEEPAPLPAPRPRSSRKHKPVPQARAKARVIKTREATKRRSPSRRRTAKAEKSRLSSDNPSQRG